MTIVDKVKLVVVHRRSPDVETELGTFPSKDVALPAFQEAIATHDPLRARIEPVDAESTPETVGAWKPCYPLRGPLRSISSAIAERPSAISPNDSLA
jgi:hypothetical protein